MGKCIAKTAHSCGTRHGLQVYEPDDGGPVNGYCWNCNTFVDNPYGEPREAKAIPEKERSGPTDEEIAERMKFIATLKACDLPKRRLRADCLEHFGIKVGLSEEDGKTPAYQYFPYYEEGVLKRYKVKRLKDKRIWAEGLPCKVPDLFGWEQAIATGAKRIIIVEGENDAAALWKILQMYTPEQYVEHMPAITSLPNGAGAAANDLMKLKDKVRKNFKEIVLCFDDDKAGQEAMDDVCKTVFPEAMTVTLPANDANDCIKKGLGKAAYKAVTFNAAKPKNSRLVFGEDLHKEARIPAAWGELSWPWDHINEETRGIRLCETIYLGSGVKMGKSEMLNTLGGHFIQNNGVKIFLAKPEEANRKTYKLMAGKVTGKIFHDPKVDFDFDAYDKAGEILLGNLAMVNLYQHIGWDTLKQDIYAAASWGAKAVFIDPITNFTNGMDAAMANVVLQGIAQEASALALDLGIVVLLFCHLKAHDGNISREQREKLYENGRYIGLGNCPHEFGGDIYSNQFAGSRAMMRSCNMMIGMEGNKDDALQPEIRNIRNLKILEDREFGCTGTFPLYWDSNTQWFKEM